MLRGTGKRRLAPFGGDERLAPFGREGEMGTMPLYHHDIMGAGFADHPQLASDTTRLTAAATITVL